MERWNHLPCVPQLVNGKSNTEFITSICIVLLVTTNFYLLVLTTNPKDSLSMCYHHCHSTEQKTGVHRRKGISLHLHSSKGTATRLEAVTSNSPELGQWAAHRLWILGQHTQGMATPPQCASKKQTAQAGWPGKDVRAAEQWRLCLNPDDP